MKNNAISIKQNPQGGGRCINMNLSKNLRNEITMTDIETTDDEQF